jgi:hypothetical protein
MSLIDWGIVGGIIVSVAIVLLSILMLYSGPRGSAPRSKRMGIAPEPEPLNPRRAA